MRREDPMTIDMDPGVVAQMIAEQHRRDLENAARAVVGEGAIFVDAGDLERITGTKKSTWRYWAMNDEGPASLRLGKRRVWRLDVVLDWLVKQGA